MILIWRVPIEVYDASYLNLIRRIPWAVAGHNKSFSIYKITLYVQTIAKSVLII